ncbi:uncharacterized protein LOC115796875 isoform X2 [Archocentrus centrarchus]|uniref:uncharacterized protein LOC115796875 isoform X2 n=1 Tax=Archocentrus centrarchus TaxID=63155 RepID=UPI0011EA4995|nr:uncharacterized protein LOC115796875 isoform X2 [Archocentrus centrarchus]
MHPSIISKGGLVGSITLAFSNHGCPLCPKFKTRSDSAIKRHMENHKSNGVHFQDTVICRCNQPCRDGGHFHCPFCPQTIVRKEDAETHVSRCKEMQMQRPTSVPPHIIVIPRFTPHKKNVQRPPSIQYLKEFIKERLTAACEEIFSEVQKTVVQYEEEIDRQCRLLDMSRKPDTNSHITDLPQQHDCEEEEGLDEQQVCTQETNSSLDQEDPEPPQIKEEQEEVCSSQEGEQLGLKQEAEGIWTDEERLRLLETIWKPEIKSDRIDLQQQHVCEEDVLTEQQVYKQETNSGVDQEDAEPPQFKEEQEELCCSHEGEQLGLKQEAEAFMVTPTYEESDHSESEQSNEQLLSHSFPEAESRDQEESQDVDSGSTRNAELKKRKRKRSHTPPYEESDHSEAEPSNEQLVSHSSPETESQDQEESRDVDSGSTRNAELKKRRAHRKRSHSQRVRRQSLTESPEPEIFRTIEEDPENQTINLDPESDLSHPEQDHDPIPRLRRTKSEQITSQMNFDSDGPYDSSPTESGEKYIPKISGECSADNGRDIIESNDQKKGMLSYLNPGIMDYVRDGYFSSKEVNNGSSKQMGTEGCSPTRKGRLSGMKHKRRCVRTVSSSAAKSKYCPISKHGALESENPTPDLGQNLPASSPLHAVVDGSLSIAAATKKKNGSRMYNKKQYCLYCKTATAKIARHLERAHSNKPEVALAFSFPKGSKQRRMHLEHLRNFAHNLHVLNAGFGDLVPRKKPKKDSQAQNFLHCVYCQGLFTKKLLSRHMLICKFKPCGEQPAKIRGQALCPSAALPPPGVTAELWKLLNNMFQDEVCSAVKSDICIMEYGEHLYIRLGYDVSKHEYIRQKLRDLGRLLICSRKITPLNTIEDHIKPVNFLHVVQAVKHLAGYDSETNRFKCPSVALKIGYSLTKISVLVESRAKLNGDSRAAKDAHSFRRVYEAKWNELIPATSLRTLQESKWNAPLLLSFTKDIQTLHSYLDAQQKHFHSKLSTEASPQAWSQLTKLTLTQVVLVNRQRAGQVSKTPLSVYLSQNPSDPQDDVDAALSNIEKKLCQHFRRIEIRGKRGRKVPVLLTPPMQQALDLLVSKRQECGVPQENVYLFAKPRAFSCYRGSDCLRHFANVCGAESPESLTSAKLRKQTATLSQVLNLTDTELVQLADFLGHDKRVHQEFYRLPEGTLQLAKISKVLMALEQGRLTEFNGKTLDDISIDPEENVDIDSDTEMVDSDSQDLQQQHVCEEEEVLTEQHVCNQETNSGVDQEDAEPPQFKEEQEGCCRSQEGEQLAVNQEADTFMVTPTYEESDHSEAEPNSEQLLSHSSPEVERQDEEESQHVDSGSTSNAQLKKRRHYRKIPHSVTEGQDLPQQHDCEEEEGLDEQLVCNQETNSSLDQEDPEPPHIKEEQEEVCSSQEGEQLGLKQEAESIIVWTGEEWLRLVKTIWKPEIKLHRIDLQQQYVCEEVLTQQQVFNQEKNSSLDQEDPEPPEIKEEQEELCSSQFGLKQEADSLMATPTYEERGHTELEPNSEQLLSHSCPEAKNQDQEESQYVTSGSTRNAEMKKTRHHRKKSHSQRLYNVPVSESQGETDTTKKSIHCDTCGKSFQYKSQLATHLRMHTVSKCSWIKELLK